MTVDTFCTATRITGAARELTLWLRAVVRVRHALRTIFAELDELRERADYLDELHKHVEVVVPVPEGWSPEQAWEAIARDEFPTDRPIADEARVHVDGAGKLIRVLSPGAAEGHYG